jgi:gliding motility-associated-like protein
MHSRLLIAFMSFLLWSGPLAAQQCTGSLGDPVINETFGEGRAVLPSYKTHFPNVNGCPPKDSYTLSNFLFGCGDRTWVQLVGDHTGDHNGNYMLVNAESEPGIVYTDTAKNLCGSTVYQFGVWITSVMTKMACGGSPVLPNVHYKVSTLSGTVLAEDSTGKLPVADDKKWNFYPLLLQTPAAVNTLVITLYINPPFGCGSAFALDDITLRPCGPSITTVIDGTPGPAEVCADYTNPFLMQASYTPGFTDPVLQWQSSTDTGRTWVDIPGATANSYAVPHRGTGAISYRVSIAERVNIASLYCRISSNVIFTSIHPVPDRVPAQVVKGCLGKSFFFPDADPFALQVQWTGPNNYSSTLAHSGISSVQVSDTGLYQLKQVFYYNCQLTDTFFLKAFPGTTVTVPSPDPACEGQPVQLSASAVGQVTYAWSPSTGLSDNTSGSPVALPHDSTRYKVVVTNQYGCQDSAYLQLDIYKKPVAVAGPDKTIIKGDTAVLNGMVSGTAVTYNWTPADYLDNGQSVTPHAYPPVSKTYTLQVNSTVGCGSVSDAVNVKVYNIYGIPNAFSPNGDFRNDVFRVLLPDNYKLLHLWMYNRWGQRIFSASGTGAGWDGTYRGQMQPAGMYIYELELQAGPGTLIRKKGTVMLLR